MREVDWTLWFLIVLSLVFTAAYVYLELAS